MNRYWNALTNLSSATNTHAFQTISPWNCVTPEQSSANRLSRILAKYVLYPARTSLLRGMDIVHVLDHSFVSLLKWADPNAVTFVTVHDLAPLETDEGLTPSQLLRFRRQCEYLRKADWLLCDSDYTRNVLHTRLNLSGPHVITLPLGTEIPARLEETPFDQEANQNARSIPYMMVVGGVSPRKNLFCLPRVLKGIQDGGVKVTIVKVGPPLPESLAREIQETCGASSLKEVGSVDDARLFELYRRAAFMFFPSKYEGFGFPVLEAMAQGCPVICSNATSIPEVGGDAVLYFPPHDTASAVHHALALLTCTNLRQEFRERGLRRAQGLSWSAHWEKLTSLYTKALMEPNASRHVKAAQTG